MGMVAWRASLGLRSRLPRWSYAGVMRVRGGLYDRGVLRAHHAPLPVLSVGNLSVGGTGKTPLVAWAATRMREAGARPAILLRGYGGDETLVHAALNPAVPVIVDADRVRGEAARPPQVPTASSSMTASSTAGWRAPWTGCWWQRSSTHSRDACSGGPTARAARRALTRARRGRDSKRVPRRDADRVATALQTVAPHAAVAVCHLAIPPRGGGGIIIASAPAMSRDS